MYNQKHKFQYILLLIILFSTSTSLFSVELVDSKYVQTKIDIKAIVADSFDLPKETDGFSEHTINRIKEIFGKAFIYTEIYHKNKDFHKNIYSNDYTDKRYEPITDYLVDGDTMLRYTTGKEGLKIKIHPLVTSKGMNNFSETMATHSRKRDGDNKKGLGFIMKLYKDGVEYQSSKIIHRYVLSSGDGGRIMQGCRQYFEQQFIPNSNGVYQFKLFSRGGVLVAESDKFRITVSDLTRPEVDISSTLTRQTWQKEEFRVYATNRRDTGSGVRKYQWSYSLKTNPNVYVPVEENRHYLDIKETYDKVKFSITDYFGNTNHKYVYPVKIDSTAPTIGIEENTPTDIWTNKASYTITADPKDGKSGLESYYWQIKSGSKWINQANKVKSLTVDSNMTVNFYADDKAGNPTELREYNIVFDYKAPTLSKPEFLGYRKNIQNGGIEAKIRWIEPGSEGGSPISSSILFVNNESIAASKESDEIYYIPLDDLKKDYWGKSLSITTYAKDEAGNESLSGTQKSLSLTIPSKVGEISIDKPSLSVVSNTVNYSFNIPVIEDDNTLYRATLMSNDGKTVYATGKLTNYTVNSYNYTVGKNGIGEEWVSLKIESVYIDKDGEFILDTYIKDNIHLDKIGSKPVLKQENGTNSGYINTQPTFSYSEKYSDKGEDIDGNIISSYTLKGFNPDGTYLGAWDITNKSKFTLPESTLINPGLYTFKIESSDNKSSENFPVLFDRSSPKSAVLGLDRVTNKDRVTIKVDELFDNGPAGLDQIEFNIDGELKQYSLTSLTTSSKNFDIDLGIVEDGTVLTKSIFVTVYDKAGNSTVSDYYNITVDKELPVVTKAESILTTDSIKYRWLSEDQVAYRIDEGAWIESSTVKEYDLTGLPVNTTKSIVVQTKDMAGNISIPITFSNTTFDILDNITLYNISTIRKGDLRLIEIKINTTEDKGRRYIIETPGTTDDKLVKHLDFYDAAAGKYITQFKYSKKVSSNFLFKIKNTADDVNTNFITIPYIPINFKPELDSSFNTIPANNGYLSASGDLVWNGIKDIDIDPLTFTVNITLEDGTLKSKTGVDINSINIESLFSELFKRKPADKEVIKWSIVATDGFSSLETGVFAFTTDDKLPEIVTNNIRTNDYTTKLSYDITDDGSGVGNVTIYDGIKELTPVITGNSYEVDLTGYASGFYDSIKVVVTDSAGNELTYKQPKIYIDNVNPEITSNILTSFTSDGQKFLNDRSKLNVNFDISDDLSGVTDIYYIFSDNESISLESNWNLLTSGSSNGKVKRLGGNREVSLDWIYGDGVSKYLFIKVIDDSGRYSDYKRLSLPIYTDTTPPEFISSNVSGLIESNLSRYLPNINSITIVDNYRDDNQKPEILDIMDKEYLLRSSQKDITLKDLNSKSFNSPALTDGERYSVIIRAYNRSGKYIENNIENFIYDSSSPKGVNITLEDNGSYISGEEIEIEIEAEDSGSGISYGEITIGSDSEDLLFKTLDKGWKLDNKLFKNSFSYKLPKSLVNGSYTINAVVYDFTGKSSSVTKLFFIDNSKEKLNLHLSRYTSLKDNNKFSFNFNRLSSVQKVEYRLNDGFWSVIDPASYSKDIDLNTPLVHGAMNVVELKVTTTQGKIFTDSRIITYDATSPLDTGSDSELCSKYVTPGNLNVKWNVSDNESGIDEIIHTVDKLVDGNWIPVAESVSVKPIVKAEQTNFKLGEQKGDKFRIRREITNGAGLVSGRTSWIVEVDSDIEAELTNIIDNANYLKPTATPKVNWINTQGDSESGMTYYWSFSRNIYDFKTISDWTIDDGSKRVSIDINSLSLKPKHGETWFFYVKGVNGAGMETYGSSNGIIFDNEAPDNIEVKLINNEISSHINYLTDQKNLKVYIDSNETSGSVVTYAGDFGTLDKLGNYLRVSPEQRFWGTENFYGIKKDEITTIDGIILFKTVAIDEAGNETDEGFSEGTVYDNSAPVVKDPGYYIDNGLLTAYWGANAGGTPLDYYYIRLQNSLGKGVSIPGNTSGKVKDKQLNFNLEDLENGIYTLYIEAVGASGLRSKPESITDIVVDNSLPVINRITTPTYIYRDLIATLDIADEGSGINEYHYTVGTSSNNTALTGDWIKISRSILNGEFELTDNLYSYSGYKNITDGESIYLYVKFRDRAGNWSKTTVSDSIILDSTLVEGIGIRHDFENSLNNAQDSVKGLTIDGFDSISGITELEVSLYKLTDGIDYLVSKNTEIINRDNIEITDYTFATENLQLEDKAVYRLGVRVANGSNIYTDSVYSEVFMMDLTYPTISFDNPLWVFNNNLTDVLYTRSEEATVEFKLFKDGISEAVKTEVLTSGEPFIFDHGFTDEEDAYGNYRLSAVVTDLAGNISTYETDNLFIQNIRYNEPPHIVLRAEYLTTPGKPYKIEAINIYDKDDNDELLSYSWSFDTSGKSDIQLSNEKEPVVKFYQTSNSVSESTFSISIEVTDNYGKSRSETFQVVVGNTSKGSIYTDEFWLGEHTLNGEVIVPKDLSLTVTSGTTVYGTEEGMLTIDGQLSVNGSSFISKYENRWKGIVINDSGGGTLNSTLIRDAFRGLTVKNSGVLSLEDSTVENNNIGIHVYNSSPVILNSRIVDNYAYGIKEDGADSDPVFDDLTIVSGNTINFYDSVDTFTPGVTE